MRHLLALALLGALSVTSSFARADEPATTAFAHLGPIVMHGNEADNLLLGAGVFDLRHHASGAGTAEYRFGRKVFVIGLTLGLMANTDGGLFGYAGAYADLSYETFYLTPQLAMGGYGEGRSQDLGGVFRHQSGRGGAVADLLLAAWSIPLGALDSADPRRWAVADGDCAHGANA